MEKNKQVGKTNILRDGFFGWNNFKWLVIEMANIYSTKKSHFSKKRIESGLSFAIAQGGMILFLMEKHKDLSMGEFLLWATAEFAVSGYMLNQIQKEKKSESQLESTSDTSSEEEVM